MTSDETMFLSYVAWYVLGLLIVSTIVFIIEEKKINS